MNFLKLQKKLNNKYFLSLAGNGSMAVLSVVTYAVLFRLLPEDDMGNWIFYQFAFVLLDSFRTGFLQTALIKFYSGSSDERKADIAGSAWYIAIILTALFIVPNIPALFALDILNDTGVLLFIQWYGISLLLSLPFNVAFWILQAEERFDQILILRIINQGSFIIFLLFVYFFSHISIQMTIYSFLASSLVTSFISILLGWSRLSALRSKTAAGVKELFHFGKFSVGTYVCSSLLRSSDAFIIKFMLGPAALAIYNLPQRLGEIIEIPMRSFVYTALPELSAAYNREENDRVTYIMKKYTGLLTMFLIPVVLGMILMADVMVLLLGGQKYINTESANIFRIFMFFSLLAPMDRFPGITLDIIHKPHLNLIKVVLSLVVNIIADVAAIKVFGNIYGPAVASIFTLVFAVGFGYWALKKYLPYNMKGIIKLGYAESRILFSGMIKKIA